MRSAVQVLHDLGIGRLFPITVAKQVEMVRITFAGVTVAPLPSGGYLPQAWKTSDLGFDLDGRVAWAPGLGAFSDEIS